MMNNLSNLSKRNEGESEKSEDKKNRIPLVSQQKETKEMRVKQTTWKEKKVNNKRKEK